MKYLTAGGRGVEVRRERVRVDASLLRRLVPIYGWLSREAKFEVAASYYEASAAERRRMRRAAATRR